MNFHWILWYNFYSIYFLFDYTNLYTVTYYFGMVSQAYLVWNYLGSYIYICFLKCLSIILKKILNDLISRQA